MIIDENLLQKLEKLSALKIACDKREEVENQLSKILDFVDILNELKFDEDFKQSSNFSPLREDIPKEDPEVIKIILENAPSKKDDFFVVSKIIE